MKQIVLSILLVIISSTLYAQKETANWTFGIRAGLSWTNPVNNISVTGINTYNTTLNNMPLPFEAGKTSESVKLYNDEGVFTISDKEGRLMFYSDGMSIWNSKNECILENALGGNISSAQSGIALPYPGRNDLYICIGIEELSNNKMTYVLVYGTNPDNVAIVGNVTPFEGNTGPLGESMSAIMHDNNKYWWIVAPGKGSNVTFNSWLATDDYGILSSVPARKSSTGINLTSGARNPGGYFKFTPNGKHFIYALGYSGCIIGDFDNKTGAFSNFKYYTSSYYNMYGVEFSPNEEYVYTTTRFSPNIYVWDINTLINDSNPKPIKTLTSNSTTSYLGAIQQDPFGRLWAVDKKNTRSLFIIDNPDEVDNLRFYRLDNYLSPGTQAQSGLPSFSASFFSIQPLQGNEKICATDAGTYSLKSLQGSGINLVDHLTWDLGDGTTTTTGTPWPNDNIHNVSHAYKKRGQYTITVTPYKDAAEQNPITAKIQTFKVKVNSCKLPVNHNISTITK